MPKKPWQTSAWRKKRSDFIKDKSCKICGSTEYLTIHHPQNRLSLSDEVYESFEGCIILCRRCHHAGHKGMILCTICMKRYRKPKFDMCWECFSKTDKGKLLIDSRIKAMSEKEAPIVNVTLPCMKVVQTYEYQLKYGGILEVCNHQCPLDTEPNSCDIYKKHRIEEDRLAMGDPNA